MADPRYERPDPPENYPAWKYDLAQKALDIDGVATEIEETRYGHRYLAAQADGERVWLATIETDNAEGLDRDPTVPKVTFDRCQPGKEHKVFYEWTTVAVNRLGGPSDLKSWRSIFRVFAAADGLLRDHSEAIDWGGDLE